MKVRLLVNTRYGASFVRAGTVIEVDKKTADDIIKRGVAEAIDKPERAPDPAPKEHAPKPKKKKESSK